MTDIARMVIMYVMSHFFHMPELFSYSMACSEASLPQGQVRIILHSPMDTHVFHFQEHVYLRNIFIVIKDTQLNIENYSGKVQQTLYLLDSYISNHNIYCVIINFNRCNNQSLIIFFFSSRN